MSSVSTRRSRLVAVTLAAALGVTACLSFNDDGRYMCDPSTGDDCDAPDGGTFVPPAGKKDGGDDAGEPQDAGAVDAGGERPDAGMDAGLSCLDDGGGLGLCLAATYAVSSNGTIFSPWSPDGVTVYVATASQLVRCTSPALCTTVVNGGIKGVVGGKPGEGWFFDGTQAGRIQVDGGISYEAVPFPGGGNGLRAAMWGSTLGELWIAPQGSSGFPGVMHRRVDGIWELENVPSSGEAYDLWGAAGMRAQAGVSVDSFGGQSQLWASAGDGGWFVMQYSGGPHVAVSGTRVNGTPVAFFVGANPPMLRRMLGQITVEQTPPSITGLTDIWISDDGTARWATSECATSTESGRRLFRRAHPRTAASCPEFSASVRTVSS